MVALQWVKCSDGVSWCPFETVNLVGVKTSGVYPSILYELQLEKSEISEMKELLRTLEKKRFLINLLSTRFNNYIAAADSLAKAENRKN